MATINFLIGFGVGRIESNVYVGRLNVNIYGGRIWRYRLIGRRDAKQVATRGPQLSLLMTTVPRAEPCALITNVKTVQRRPFEFLPLSLKNVGGVFQTSSVVITLLSINTSKLYHF